MADNATKYAKLAFVLMANDSMSTVLADAVKNANGSFSKLEVRMAEVGETSLRIGTHFTQLGKQITSSVFNVVKEAADYVDTSGELAQAAGLQTEEWQKLAYAAKFSGVSTEQLQGAMSRLNKYIGAASTGVGRQSQVFKDLGIKIHDAAGAVRPSQEIFKDLSSAFKNMKIGAAKSTLQMELMGKSGTKMADLLNRGRGGLEDLGKEAERLGLVNTSEQLNTFNDLMDTLKGAALGVTIQLADALAPAISYVLDVVKSGLQMLASWTKEHQSLTRAIGLTVAGFGALSMAAGAVSTAVGKISYVILQSIRFVNYFRNSMFLFRIQYYGLTVGLKLAAAAQWLFNTSLFGCPIVWIIAGVAAFIAIVVLLVKKWDTVSAALKASWDYIVQVVTGAGRAIGDFFRGLWSDITGWFVGLWDGIVHVFAGAGQAIDNFFRGLWNGIAGWFVGLWEHVKAVFSRTWEWIKGMFLKCNPYGLIITHWDSITGWFAGLWENVKAVFLQTWEWMKGLFLKYTPQGLIITHWDSITGWFAGMWGNVKAVFSQTWEWMKGLFLKYTPYGLIITHWDGITGWFAGMWGNVKAVFSQTWEWVKGMFLKYTPYGLIITHWDGITGWFAGMWENIVHIFATAGQAIGAFFRELWENPLHVFTVVGQAIGDFFRGLWDGIVGYFTAAGQAIGDFFRELWENPLHVLTVAGQAIGDFFRGVWDGIVRHFAVAGKAIGDFFLDLWDGILGHFTAAGQAIGDFFRGLWNGILGHFTVAGQAIGDFFRGLWDGIVGHFTAAGQAIGDFFRELWDGISGWFAGLWENVGNVLANGWQTVTDFFTGLPAQLFNFGANLLHGLIDGMMSLINRPAELIREVASNIGNVFRNLLGIHSPSALFMEYGINITRGLTGGIDTGLPAIVNSTGRMAAQAVDGFGRSFQVHAERSESTYEQLQRGYESAAAENLIIPASQIFNNSGDSIYRGGDLPIQYTQNITFSGSMSEQDKQDFSQELRRHANDVVDIMQRYFDNKERLSFN